MPGALHLPGLPPMQAAPTAQVVAVNDLQLIALVAAQMATPGVDPGQAVETACDLIAAAILAAQGGRLAHYLDVRRGMVAVGVSNA